MKNTLPDDLLEATRLTNAGRLTEATAALQRMLGGEVTLGSTNPQARRDPPIIDGVAEAAGTAEVTSTRQAGPGFGTGAGQRSFAAAGDAMQPPMPEALRGFLDQVGRGGFQLPGGGLAHPSPAAPRVPAPDGAQFLAATFTNEVGSRPYKLYVPSGYHPGQAVPFIVMLHGCAQSPDDFAAGTRMNEVAEEHTCLVAYPGQTSAANMQ